MKESERNRDIDELLDAALALYGSEEPRPGLEARILAHVRANERASRGRAWAWGLAAASAVLLGLAVALLAPRRHPAPVASAPRAVATRLRLSPIASTPIPGAPRGAAREIRSVKVKPPPPEQFPAPEPLSDEERLLVAYASKIGRRPPGAWAALYRGEGLTVPQLEIRGLEIKELRESDE